MSDINKLENLMFGTFAASTETDIEKLAELQMIMQRKQAEIDEKEQQIIAVVQKMKIDKLKMEQAEIVKIESSNRLLNLTSEELTHQFESYTDSLRFEIQLRDYNMMRFLTCAYRRELQLQPGIVGSFDDMRQLLYGFLFRKSWYRHNLRFGKKHR